MRRHSAYRWLVRCLVFLASVQFSLGTARGQVETELYCEDFNNGAQGWSALDVDASRRPTEIFWHLEGGDWLCATTDPCFADPGPGYGDNWVQRLDKSYALPSSGPVSLDQHHGYSVEAGFDFCVVEVLPEGAGAFVELASYTGTSAGIVNNVIDLSAYAGTTVTIRFRFTSDNVFSDEDGGVSTNGAWRIDRLTVSGYAEEDFATEQGWTPSFLPLAPALATFRLDSAPPCQVADYLVADGITSLNCEHPSLCGPPHRGGAAWVAFDRTTRTLTEVPEDYDRFFIPGIESPVIPIPPPVGTSEYRLEVDVFSDQTFVDTRVVWQQNFAYPAPGASCPPRFEREFQWNSMRATGWFGFVRVFEPPAGATNVQLRLNITDWANLTGVSRGTARGQGPFFDNVRVVHVTAPPGPPVLECRADMVVSTAACTFPAPEITFNHGVILRVLDDTTPRNLLALSQTPSPGTPMSSGESVTLNVTDMDGLVSADCNVRVWNENAATVTILDVTPAVLWPPDHQMVPVAVTFEVQNDCTSEPAPGIRVRVSSSEPDNGLRDGETTGDVNGSDGFVAPVELPVGNITQNTDGSFTATMDLRAERVVGGPGRVYGIVVDAPGGPGGGAAASVEVPAARPIGSSATSEVIASSAALPLDDVGTLEWADSVEPMNGTGRPAKATSGKMILDLSAEPIESTIRPAGASGRQPVQEQPGDAAERRLESVFPNPSARGATVRFTLAKSDEVVLSVLDVRGRLVRRLAEGAFAAGSHRVAWDGRDDRGRVAAAGYYFIKLRTSESEESRKLIFTR